MPPFYFLAKPQKTFQGLRKEKNSKEIMLIRCCSLYAGKAENILRQKINST